MRRDSRKLRSAIWLFLCAHLCYQYAELQQAALDTFVEVLKSTSLMQGYTLQLERHGSVASVRFIFNHILKCRMPPR